MGFLKDLFIFIEVLTKYGGLNLGPVHTAAALLAAECSFIKFSCNFHIEVDGYGQQLTNICANSEVSLALSLPMQLL